MASSTVADQSPMTPKKQIIQANQENVSPCPSASTSGQSFLDSTPTTPPSGPLRNDTTLAERRGKAIGPLVDSVLLDHPIYGYTRNAHVNFADDRTPRAGDDVDLAQYDMDAKTPKPKEISDASSIRSASPAPNSITPSSEDDLGRRGLPSACVFIANLAATRTDDELQKSLQAHFGKLGRIHVKIRRDEKGNPYSFCQFENDEDAKKAIREGRGQVIDGSGRRIRCEPAKVNRTLLLAKLDNGVFEEKEARKALYGFGQLESLEFISGKYAAARGIRNGCFVRFVYRQDAVDCHQYFRSHSTWTVEWANNGPGAAKSPTSSQIVTVDPYSIFVGQLNPDTITREAIYERFGKYGTILDCNLVIKPGKFGLGKNAFAFIKYDDHLSATRAIDQENNCPFLGKIIHVQRREFHDKPNRNNVQDNHFGHFRLASVGDMRSGNTPAISFSVADVADLAARLSLNYANQGNFNPRQPGLAPRSINYPGDALMQMQSGSNSAPAVIFPVYPQFFYGGPTAAPASPRTTKESNAPQEQTTYNGGYYPQVEGHAGQTVPNPELLHPHFSIGSHYDNHYNSYVPAHYVLGQNSGTVSSPEPRFGVHAYSSERYEHSKETPTQNVMIRGQQN